VTRVVGFTGTRRGMTARQSLAFKQWLAGIPAGIFHHGDCTGADSRAHDIALELGWTVEIHPPDDNRHRAFCKGAAVVHDPLPYLKRNARILEASDDLAAAPAEYIERLRGSGTWSTIRGAERRGVPVHIFWPNGSSSLRFPPELSLLNPRSSARL
jgi:hypothetical protein